jgi:3-methylcrotonyl-CoA carboxylase alpha subunit/acetyl-CoA/propionyl-CoA carboxylase biotin carboxyl carrier protein
MNTVLVANRGEVALRVIEAAHACGMRAVAVYSDADRESPHLRQADDAVALGPASAADSYLSIERLMRAAVLTGADAVHPGYGFLAESPSFARACEEAGLCFVGPSADVIEAMGSKARARHLAEEADVPVVPGLYDHSDQWLLENAATAVGFPLMVKAAAGGGGKGMRAVLSSEELSEALRQSRREALSAFADDTLVIERLLEAPRHVEVQILADGFGNIVHLFERDCSVQRRHQKVVEESPAPGLSDELRKRLCAAAKRLAAGAEYVNAGTVEFIVSGEEYYFLEMNTRLQVEHSVTELVTGTDLVKAQLQVAAGMPIGFTQADIEQNGHAIEARLYAEDPEHGFIPQAGTVSGLRWPRGVRLDTALEQGQVVGTHYDPMLAKITSHAPSRQRACNALVTALDDTAVFGVKTNLGFLRELLASQEFGQAAVATDWLDKNPGAFGPGSGFQALVAAAWHKTVGPPATAPDPFDQKDSWRLGGKPAPIPVELISDGATHHLMVDRRGGSVTDSAHTVSVRTIAAEQDRLTLELDGGREVFHIQAGRDVISVIHRGALHRFRDAELLVDAPDTSASDGVLLAPMPGTVVEVNTEQGQTVRMGQTLVVIEAMKMELSISAPFDGKVAKTNITSGQQVPLGHLLLEVEADAAGI